MYFASVACMCKGKESPVCGVQTHEGNGIAGLVCANRQHWLSDCSTLVCVTLGSYPFLG